MGWRQKQGQRKLIEVINKVLAMPELRDKLSGEAIETMPMTPEQFGKYIESEIAHWTRVARASNIEVE